MEKGKRENGERKDVEQGLKLKDDERERGNGEKRKEREK
jgi:hypothetical protein